MGEEANADAEARQAEAKHNDGASREDAKDDEAVGEEAIVDAEARRAEALCEANGAGVRDATVRSSTAILARRMRKDAAVQGAEAMTIKEREHCKRLEPASRTRSDTTTTTTTRPKMVTVRCAHFVSAGPCRF